MAEKSATKTVIVEPDVHAAVKVLSALYDKPMQEIINEAVRAQYDVDKLANIDEAVLGEGGGDLVTAAAAELAENEAAENTSGAE